MTFGRQFQDHVFDHRVLISLLALAGGVELWFLPAAAARHGGGAFILMWMILVLVIGLPVILFEIAIGSSLQGTLSEGIRKASRRAEWLSWTSHVLSLAMGVIAAVFAAWCLGLAFDAVLSLFGNTPPPWETAESLEQLDRPTVAGLREGILETVTGRGSDPSGDLLLRIGRAVPAGRVMVALAVIWFAVLWVAVKGISGFRLLARILVPILLVVIVLNLLVQLNRFGAAAGVAHLFGPRWEACFSLDAWVEAACLALVTVPIGLGLQATLAGVSMRQFDFASASLGSLAVVLVLHLLVLLAVAGALGAWALGMQVRLAELELPGVEPVLVGLPASTCGQGTSPWVAALLQLFGILPLLLLAYATASALILSPILAWSRHRRVNLRKAAVTLGVFPVAASLAFATNEGYVLWRGLADSLRYLLLPLGVALLLRTGVKTVGAGGLADHITAYSALKVGPWWRVLVRWVLPTGLLILALYRGMAYCEGHDYEPLGCSLFLAPLVLLPLAAWSAKSFANRGRR